MLCTSPVKSAFTALPAGYHIRTCRPQELPIWKAIHFDDVETARAQEVYMTRYFDTVYAPAGDAFYERCLFLCTDDGDTPIGTCFAWQAYGHITTIHWYKIRRAYEGQGLGRALLSEVLRRLEPSDYPVYLHTQPGSYRAIKLYTDFGFAFLSDPVVGYRENHLPAALGYLKRKMPSKDYDALRFASAPEDFLSAAKTTEYSQF
ncbi:MAG: GNAT family N-acetyltransferase [Clostridia bacterium]|nr:GNAT family N-acetyltransferase [Clostridia bacterium]